MGLSAETLNALKHRDEEDLYELASALLHVQDAILRLEMDETNPEVLRELAKRSLSTGDELEAIVNYPSLKGGAFDRG